MLLFIGSKPELSSGFLPEPPVPVDGAQREPALHILRPLEVIRQACIIVILQHVVQDHCDNALSGHQLTIQIQHDFSSLAQNLLTVAQVYPVARAASFLVACGCAA